MASAVKFAVSVKVAGCGAMWFGSVRFSSAPDFQKAQARVQMFERAVMRSVMNKTCNRQGNHQCRCNSFMDHLWRLGYFSADYRHLTRGRERDSIGFIQHESQFKLKLANLVSRSSIKDHLCTNFQVVKGVSFVLYCTVLYC